MTQATVAATSPVRVIMVVVLVLMVFVAMLLTSHAMSVLRVEIPQLSRGMNWLEALNLPFDMDHVAFFTAMTCVARLLLPRLNGWWLLLAVAFLAASTEVIQYWVPGRTPKLLDARDDMIGGALGLLLGSACLLISRSLLNVAQPLVRWLRGHDSKAGSGE